MAASLGARLLGCGATSSLPPPYKVCGAPRRRQRPTRAPGSGNSKPWASWRSLWNPPRRVRRAVPAQSCLQWLSIFRRRVGSLPPAGEAKGSAFRNRLAAGSHTGETEVQNAEQNANPLPRRARRRAQGHELSESGGCGGRVRPDPRIMDPSSPSPSRRPALMKSWKVRLKGTRESPSPSGL